MLTRVNELWAQARSDWQANPRLRLGALVVGIILLIVLHQRLDQWREARMQQAAQAYRSLHELQIVAADGQWPQRAEQARKARASLTDKLWVAASEGAAEAAVRDRIQAEAREHGVSIERLSVRTMPAQPGAPYQAVRAEVQGAYQAPALQHWLAGLAGQEPALLIDAERIDRTLPQRPRYRLVLIAWYHQGSPEAQP